MISHYLQPLLNAEIDTLILGCTHYPILYRAIAEFMGKSVFLVDSGKETATYAANLLKQQNLLSNRCEKGHCTFYVSDSTKNFTEKANIFLQQNVAQTVQFIDIEAYPQKEYAN